MSDKVKALIERLINVERINKPKEIHKALNREDVEKEIDIRPTKEQIVAYVRNRRMRRRMRRLKSQRFDWKYQTYPKMCSYLRTRTNQCCLYL